LALAVGINHDKSGELLAAWILSAAFVKALTVIKSTSKVMGVSQNYLVQKEWVRIGFWGTPTQAYHEKIRAAVEGENWTEEAAKGAPRGVKVNTCDSAIKEKGQGGERI